MAVEISITEAARNFSDFINRVAYRQESFFLVRGKRAVAELKPVAAGRRLPELARLLEDCPQVAAGEWNGFRQDIAKVRTE